jgi:hypothetical protein
MEKSSGNEAQRLSTLVDDLATVLLDALAFLASTDQEIQRVEELSKHVAAVRAEFGPPRSSAIADHRIWTFECAMPKQPTHWFHRGKTCVSNPDHTFCARHNLERCVIDGSELR